MRYQKPELICVAAAIDAVQNPQNKIEQVTDVDSVASAAAYASDE